MACAVQAPHLNGGAIGQRHTRSVTECATFGGVSSAGEPVADRGVLLPRRGSFQCESRSQRLHTDAKFGESAFRGGLPEDQEPGSADGPCWTARSGASSLVHAAFRHERQVGDPAIS